MVTDAAAVLDRGEIRFMESTLRISPATVSSDKPLKVKLSGLQPDFLERDIASLLKNFIGQQDLTYTAQLDRLRGFANVQLYNINGI